MSVAGLVTITKSSRFVIIIPKVQKWKVKYKKQKLPNIA